MSLFFSFLRLTLMISLSMTGLSASAQSYYKCKTANGRIQYSDQFTKGSDCKPISVRVFGAPNVNMPVTTGVLAKDGSATAANTAAPTQTPNTQPVTPAPAAPQATPKTTPTITPQQTPTTNNNMGGTGLSSPSPLLPAAM